MKKLTLMVPDELIDTIERNQEKLGSLTEMLKRSIEEQIAIGENVQRAIVNAGLSLYRDKSDDE